MHEFIRNSLHELKDKYARWPANKAISLPNGRPPDIDELFYQKRAVKPGPSGRGDKG